MKRGIAFPITPVFALLMVLAGTSHAQRSPSDDIRESNDPDRAAEVERKAEAISGRRLEGSGESGEEASETAEPDTLPEWWWAPEEERGEGESGGTQESSEPPDDYESSGASGRDAPTGGGGNEGKTKPGSPAGKGNTYH